VGGAAGSPRRRCAAPQLLALIGSMAEPGRDPARKRLRQLAGTSYPPRGMGKLGCSARSDPAGLILRFLDARFDRFALPGGRWSCVVRQRLILRQAIAES